MEFIKPSWDEIEELTKKLAEKIKKSRFRFDWIVGISRGGLLPARLVSDYFDCPQLAIMRIEFYKSIGKTKDFPRITQPVQVNVKGKNVLVVDDVADTGQSLVVAKEHLKRKGAKEVRIATLHYKPTSSAIKPDFYVAKTSAWIVYPWEKRETERMLKKKVEEL
ncbi:MAG: phosphoribosyltransferase [Candidatus Anstonellales archaeon]